MFAQVLKSDMRVNLIGGANEGLPIEHAAVICVDIGERTDIKLYMKYDEENGVFYEESFETALPSRLREQAYETMRLRKSDGSPMIGWEGNMTVDEGNKLYLAYIAEGDLVKAETLQLLIKDAKDYIRNLYPD